MKDKIIDYTLVSEEDYRILEGMVIAYIRDGWQPIGGITFSSVKNSSGLVNGFHQALVKYENQ